jgi:uncharacterized protein YkwD
MINLVQKKKRRPHHFFIPSEHNDHKPHFVGHKALHFYSASLIAVKIFVVAFLFITFPSTAEFSTVTSNRIIELTNESRQQEGYSVLIRSSKLDASAMAKARHMIENNYFAHDCPNDGTTPWEFFKDADYNYTFAGENLAMNFSEAEEAMQAWLDSPSHRANVMNNNYSEIGVAVLIGEIDGHQTTLVVQHFGKTFFSPGTNEFTKPSGEEAPEVAGTTQVSTGEAIEVTFKDNENRSTVGKITFYGQKFFQILLIFIGINLLLTIFIRIKVQHKPIILHCLFVILIAALMILLNLHFVERIVSGGVKIL